MRPPSEGTFQPLIEFTARACFRRDIRRADWPVPLPHSAHRQADNTRGSSEFLSQLVVVIVKRADHLLALAAAIAAAILSAEASGAGGAGGTGALSPCPVDASGAGGGAFGSVVAGGVGCCVVVDALSAGGVGAAGARGDVAGGVVSTHPGSPFVAVIVSPVATVATGADAPSASTSAFYLSISSSVMPLA